MSIIKQTTIDTIARAHGAHRELVKRLKVLDGVEQVVGRIRADGTNPCYGSISVIEVVFKDKTEVELTFKPINRSAHYETSVVRYVIDVKAHTIFYATPRRISEAKQNLDFDTVLKMVVEEAERARVVKTNRDAELVRQKKSRHILTEINSSIQKLKPLNVVVNATGGTAEAPEFDVRLINLPQEVLAKVLKALEGAL